MPKFISAKSVRVSDNIAGQLKNAILSGSIKPGEKLPSERELTETFQVSRVGVREAIRTLEFTGFVNIKQGPLGGAYVQRLGYDRLTESYNDLFLAGLLTVREMVQARIYLEPEVTRLAAESINDKWATKLKIALESEKVPTGKHDEWVRRNTNTDYVLMEICGNRFYQAMLEPLIRLTQEIVLVVKPKRTIIHDPREHESIVEAVLAGDGPAAAEAMRKHIKNVGNSLIGLEETYRTRKGLNQI